MIDDGGGRQPLALAVCAQALATRLDEVLDRTRRLRQPRGCRLADRSAINLGEVLCALVLDCLEDAVRRAES